MQKPPKYFTTQAKYKGKNKFSFTEESTKDIDNFSFRN